MVTVPKFHYEKVPNTKVIIATPVRDYVTSAYTFSIANLMKKCGQDGQHIELRMLQGSEVAMQRQQLAVDALAETDFTHILWIDSDMRFPSNLLQALLSHKKDIIACNYSTRVPPHKPVAFKDVYNLDKRVYDGTGLEMVEAVGMGAMLVKREVFEKLEKPFFSVKWLDDYTSLMGEDIYFCFKAREAGFDIWLEQDISKQVAHVGTRAYTIQGDCNEET